MRNFWLVAKHEFFSTVTRRGFLIGTLAAPLAVAAFIGALIWFESLGENRSPIGYVDRAGLLSSDRQAALPDSADRIELRAFTDEAAARAALERDEIQAFFVLPADYQRTLRTDLYYLDEPPSNEAWEQFDDFVRLNLVAGLPEDVRRRLLAGSEIIVRDILSNREFSESGVVNIVLPYVASIVFFAVTMSAAGYMLRVVADEKENRTLEIMVTSATPTQFIGGKVLGLLAATLTQMAVYLIVTVAGIIVLARFVEPLRYAAVPWDYLGVMAAFFFPSFALIAALMVAVGASVTGLQQGQQIAGFFNLLFIFPIFMLVLLFENPSHPAILFMTFFPTTAFLTISLRWGVGTVPFWQLGVSWIILVGATLFAVWAAARVFRAGMLRYGQPLTLKAIRIALQGG